MEFVYVYVFGRAMDAHFFRRLGQPLGMARRAMHRLRPNAQRSLLATDHGRRHMVQADTNPMQSSTQILFSHRLCLCLRGRARPIRPK